MANGVAKSLYFNKGEITVLISADISTHVIYRIAGNALRIPPASQTKKMISSWKLRRQNPTASVFSKEIPSQEIRSELFKKSINARGWALATREEMPALASVAALTVGRHCIGSVAQCDVGIRKSA